jgi:hypothetical protein
MFSRPEISRELKRYICVRLYTDGDGEIFKHQQNLQQEKFGTVAPPFYVILSADESVSDTFPGLTNSESVTPKDSTHARSGFVAMVLGEEPKKAMSVLARRAAPNAHA